MIDFLSNVCKMNIQKLTSNVIATVIPVNRNCTSLKSVPTRNTDAFVGREASTKIFNALLLWDSTGGLTASSLKYIQFQVEVLGGSSTKAEPTCNKKPLMTHAN